MKNYLTHICVNNSNATMFAFDQKNSDIFLTEDGKLMYPCENAQGKLINQYVYLVASVDYKYHFEPGDFGLVVKPKGYGLSHGHAAEDIREIFQDKSGFYYL